MVKVLIKIDINKIDNWDEIKKNHLKYFKEAIENELSNLIIDNDKYISKRKRPNKDKYKIYYELEKSDRDEIEKVFGGKFSEKKSRSVFKISDAEKIEEIILGDIDKVCDIFDKSNIGQDVIKQIFNYDKFRDNDGWNRHTLIYMMNISVCPYCNRQYITSYEEDSKQLKTTADLDHYYSQDEYPFLSLSLFNFIPSCQICNSRFKIKKNFKVNPHIYPYKEEFGENAKFIINGDAIDYLLGQSNNFNIELKVKECKNKEKIINAINTFHLNKVYKIHKNYVLDIIKKAFIYNESQVLELYESYPELFQNKIEIYNLLFGIDDKKILCKLTKDICDEFEIAK
ncbi:conserved hypothetical protein [Clostridium neonatale]|uniref:hypothetical protein n=1 Tax=Clostridium neonatale TaxID=137838 RepID=UPI00291BD5BF|nr:hypothetical protein [Clostridium neonatale]CAI3206469.1 conserved hypothetical protein [Clostridium neonatale]CAI3210574.1 conserved hypothetical protein [Clostridium neonatale]CAI3676126.1 conserved hypothetical protein [Clostridium neonatale]